MSNMKVDERDSCFRLRQAMECRLATKIDKDPTLTSAKTAGLGISQPAGVTKA